MANEVYLDHLIPRENLRYKRKSTVDSKVSLPSTSLRISDLTGDHLSSKLHSLRKPDFQRATWAWTPDDCVSLLESLVKGQVIPSIIMWSSIDSGYDFILDGAHRVSVVMAWLLDDWGDKLPSEAYGDESREEQIKKAAHLVRTMVKTQIGSFDDFKKANEEFEAIIREGKSAPMQVMKHKIFEQASFYRNLRDGTGFHILWVNGDYEVAERSFLKINKSGKILDDWEIKLITNRNSSFARAIMSIANIESVDHYWPINLSEISEENLKNDFENKTKKIVSGINEINKILFKPARPDFYTSITFPLMEITEIFKRPYWVAELLTIFEGYRGHEADTNLLLSKGKDSSPEEIINSGYTLINDSLETLEHIIGSSQKSLNIVSALYFYTEAGRFVRSLLYGFIYWMFDGNPETILIRKRYFSAYRDLFEKVLFDRKIDVVTAITRQTGSGPDVTVKTANYYDGLLNLFIKHKGDIYSDKFLEDYAGLMKRIAGKQSSIENSSKETNRRLFSQSQKSTKLLEVALKNTPTCGICGGRIDLSLGVQHDHILEHSAGGKTVGENQRVVHPFCNNNANRQEIEKIRAGLAEVRIPEFQANGNSLLKQLSFFNVLEFD